MLEQQAEKERDRITPSRSDYYSKNAGLLRNAALVAVALPLFAKSMWEMAGAAGGNVALELSAGAIGLIAAPLAFISPVLNAHQMRKESQQPEHHVPACVKRLNKARLAVSLVSAGLAVAMVACPVAAPGIAGLIAVCGVAQAAMSVKKMRVMRLQTGMHQALDGGYVDYMKEIAALAVADNDGKDKTLHQDVQAWVKNVKHAEETRQTHPERLSEAAKKHLDRAVSAADHYLANTTDNVLKQGCLSRKERTRWTRRLRQQQEQPAVPSRGDAVYA